MAIQVRIVRAKESVPQITAVIDCRWIFLWDLFLQLGHGTLLEPLFVYLTNEGSGGLADTF